MKKSLLAGICIAAAACLLAACGGEGGSKAPVVVDKRPPPAEKIEPPENAVGGLKSTSDVPAGSAPAKKP